MRLSEQEEIVVVNDESIDAEKVQEISRNGGGGGGGGGGTFIRGC